MSEVKFAIPKGSLEDATFKLLERSWTKVNEKVELTEYTLMIQKLL